MDAMHKTEKRELYRSDMPCWSCHSSDGAAVYLKEKPHVHCFACGETTFNEEIVEGYMNREIPQGETTSSSGIFPKAGSIIGLTKRHITLATAEKFGVITYTQDNSNAILGHAFPFWNTAGEFVAQKLKEINVREGEKRRRMKCIGKISQATLFGQNVFPAGGNSITITEGEEDALSAYQMAKNRYKDSFEPATVSIKNGAAGAERDCKDAWEYLNSFSKIVICFDADEPGRKAAQEVARLFPGKSHIVKLDEGLDINDYLKAGRERDFINAWHSAEKLTVKGVLEFSSLWGAMTKEDAFDTLEWPWAGLNAKTYGMRTTELSIIKAPPKIGKTQVLREIAYHLHEADSNTNIGAIFLEEGIKRIGLGFCGLKMEKPIHLPNIEYSQDELKVAYEYFAKEERIHIFDPSAERTTTSLFDRMMYFVQVCNCKVILLDHISMFSYSAFDVDERRFLDKFVDDLKNFAVQHNVHICAVIHVNDEGKTRGSRAPVQLCDLLLSINRDKLNPDPVIANTTILTVEENRFSGDSGDACKLFYNGETGRMTELDEDLAAERGAYEVEFDD